MPDLTFDDFNSQIMRPLVLGYIKEGRCDSVLTDPDIIAMYADNPEIMKAIQR